MSWTLVFIERNIKTKNPKVSETAYKATTSWPAPSWSIQRPFGTSSWQKIHLGQLAGPQAIMTILRHCHGR